MRNLSVKAGNGWRIEDLTPFQELFWEADVSRIDIDKRKAYILERILEYGNRLQARWMVDRYGRGDILQVVKTSRRLSEKSRSFWLSYFAQE